MYESPIELIYSERMEEIKNGVDDTILRAVTNVGINVDKDELIKALNYDRNQYQKGYEDGRNASPQWIPVTESLPEKGEDVLVCDMYGDIYLTHRAMKRTFFDGWGTKIKDIRAWMPLPKPYKEGES